MSQQLAPLVSGSTPRDRGFLSNITETEAACIRASDPVAAKFLRRYLTRHDFRTGLPRWCLWLVDAVQADLTSSPEISWRVAEVANSRSNSRSNSLAPPWLFDIDHQPRDRYFAIARDVPRALALVAVIEFDPGVIASNQVWVLDDQSLLTAGVISSRLYELWLKMSARTSGDDLIFSAQVSHNTFPLPTLSRSQVNAIESAARRILLARAHHMDSTLDELYARDELPRPLREAHADLDAVMADAFGVEPDASDAAMRKVLSDKHRELTVAEHRITRKRRAA